jgi:RimJ/RimL family protein N-acetyltransferase
MIRFRPIEISDVLWIEAALSHKQVALNTSTIPHPMPDQFVETWVSHWQEMKIRDLGFRIVGTTADGEGFGSAAIRRTAASAGELSFWIVPRFWRQGLAHQISKAAVDRARDVGFSTLTAGHFHDNLGSLSVLNKLKFARLPQPDDVFSLSRDKIVQTVRYELKQSL